MANISLDLLKKLRAETSAGVSDCRQALDDAAGDYAKAKKLIEKRGIEKAEKKAHRATGAGIIESYVHGEGTVGVLVELRCETDFVCKTDAFKKLAHEICLQVAAMDPKDVKALLAEEYIRDSGMTIEVLVKSVVAKVGENITIGRFSRIDING